MSCEHLWPEEDIYGWGRTVAAADLEIIDTSFTPMTDNAASDKLLRVARKVMGKVVRS